MIVRSFCTWLVGRKKLRENPAHFIKSKRLTSAKHRPFCRREQMDSIIDECPSRELKFILYAGFLGGMRKGEIIQARGEWFDLSLNIIHIVESDDWKPKDKDKRTIPLSNRFRDFLENEFSIHQSKNLPWLKPHVMRHTLATRLRSKSASLARIPRTKSDEKAGCSAGRNGL